MIRYMSEHKYRAKILHLFQSPTRSYIILYIFYICRFPYNYMSFLFYFEKKKCSLIIHKSTQGCKKRGRARAHPLYNMKVNRQTN